MASCASQLPPFAQGACFNLVWEGTKFGPTHAAIEYRRKSIFSESTNNSSRFVCSADVWWPGFPRPEAYGTAKPPTSFNCGLINKVLRAYRLESCLVGVENYVKCSFTWRRRYTSSSHISGRLLIASYCKIQFS